MRLLPRFKYPVARRAVLHGVETDDPYQWLEDPRSNETEIFIRAQNELTTSYLKSCTESNYFETSVLPALHFNKFSVPELHGEYQYFTASSGENHEVIYRVKGRDETSLEAFLDPNEFSQDGTISLTDYYVSESGNYFAYTTSKAGSDWKTIFVRDTQTKEDLTYKIERVRYGSVAWLHDDSGFFYAQYPESTNFSGKNTQAAVNQKLFYHSLGSPQENDKLILEYPDHPEWVFRFEVSVCGNFLIVEVTNTVPNNKVLVAFIGQNWKDQRDLKFQTLYGNLDCSLTYIGNIGEDFFMGTDKDRPNIGLVKINLNRPELLVDVIKNDPVRPMVELLMRGSDKFIVRYLENAKNVLEIFSVEGKFLQKVALGFGKINIAPGKFSSSKLVLNVESFTNPMTFFQLDLDDVPEAELVVFHNTEFERWSPEDIEVKQEFYSSEDGTRVPMFLLHRSNQRLDGSAPAYLSVYGGFAHTMEPAFSAFHLLLIFAFGFVVAIPNVRGGGEYGKLWYDAGRAQNKQHTIDDVHAAARFLCARNYSSLGRIVLHGSSNGGFVTLASINQHPELFAAALADVPVTDLIHFKKFTVGQLWVSDYGDPDNATQLDFIRKISPLHNIPPSIDNYPALLISTGDHDDRVVPSHSLKFLAEVQYRLGETNSNPLLGYVQSNAGHGDGMSMDMVRTQIFNQICFIAKSLNLKAETNIFKPKHEIQEYESLLTWLWVHLLPSAVAAAA